MAVISGGKVIGGANPAQAGVKARVYRSNAVPTDSTIGYDGTPPNGTLAENTATGFLYERQGGAWVRVDTV
jgi:hypothetical protein